LGPHFFGIFVVVELSAGRSQKLAESNWLAAGWLAGLASAVPDRHLCVPRRFPHFGFEFCLTGSGCVKLPSLEFGFKLLARCARLSCPSFPDMRTSTPTSTVTASEKREGKVRRPIVPGPVAPMLMLLNSEISDRGFQDPRAVCASNNRSMREIHHLCDRSK
jgi:hypothetical protein